jgi:glucose/arabinose dehydrogenase
MFGIAFHPNFASNGIFYVHYSASDGTHSLGNGDTVLSEFVVSSGDPNVADAASERVVLSAEQPDWNHNGGMIAFGPDNFLYMGLGDGGGSFDAYDNGQDPNTLLATILRLDVDTRDAGEYGIPAGNITNGAPEIWDWGLRNPWRFSFDACTDDLYIADVGQNTYEEVNVEPAGMGNRNYGWPIAEGLDCSEPTTCDTNNLVEPVLDYGRSDGISVTGGYVYRGSAIPALRGTYLYGDYSSRTIWSFEYSGGMAMNQQEVNFTGRDLASEFGDDAGLTSFGQDNAGEMYITLRNGEVLKIVADE